MLPTPFLGKRGLMSYVAALAKLAFFGYQA